MSSKKQNDDENIVEKLINSVIDYSSSDIGQNEQTLNAIVRSPRWQMSDTLQNEEAATDAQQSVNEVKKSLEGSKDFQGATSDAAVTYGNNVVNLHYDTLTSSQITAIRNIEDQANSVIAFVESQKDSLPGNKLDSTSTALINGATTAIQVVVPVLSTAVLKFTGWDHPVDRINKMLRDNREKKAGELLDDVQRRFKNVAGDFGTVVDPIPGPENNPYPEGDEDNQGNTEDTRVDGPGTYLGDGAYDLNGDGSPDYYDYNMDGVPDIWVDSDGDGVPDIYDDYDPNNSTQNDDYRRAYEQINNNRRTARITPITPAMITNIPIRTLIPTIGRMIGLRTMNPISRNSFRNLSIFRLCLRDLGRIRGIFRIFRFRRTMMIRSSTSIPRMYRRTRMSPAAQAAPVPTAAPPRPGIPVPRSRPCAARAVWAPVSRPAASQQARSARASRAAVRTSPTPRCRPRSFRTA